MEDSVGTRPESVVNRRGSWGTVRGGETNVPTLRCESPRGLCWLRKYSSMVLYLGSSRYNYNLFIHTRNNTLFVQAVVEISRGSERGKELATAVRLLGVSIVSGGRVPMSAHLASPNVHPSVHCSIPFQVIGGKERSWMCAGCDARGFEQNRVPRGPPPCRQKRGWRFGFLYGTPNTQNQIIAGRMHGLTLKKSYKGLDLCWHTVAPWITRSNSKEGKTITVQKKRNVESGMREAKGDLGNWSLFWVEVCAFWENGDHSPHTMYTALQSR